MPQDMLDGIKTKKGRVVYDRKPKSFKYNDLLRIYRKLGREAFENLDCEAYQDMGSLGLMIVQDLISATDICDLDNELTNIKLVIDTAAGLNKFGGGKFGGAGTSRQF